MLNIVFVGPSYSGKGTQADMLCAMYGLEHLSTGDLLRAAMAEKTELGMKATSYMERAENVPDEIVYDIVWDYLLKHQGCPGFVLDGYPRNEHQAAYLDSMLSKLNMGLSSIFVFDKVSIEVMLYRQKERAKTSNRPDDLDPANVEKRYIEYQRETVPVIEYYEREQKAPVYYVDASKLPEEVEQQIAQYLAGH